MTKAVKIILRNIPEEIEPDILTETIEDTLAHITKAENVEVQFIEEWLE